MAKAWKMGRETAVEENIAESTADKNNTAVEDHDDRDDSSSSDTDDNWFYPCFWTALTNTNFYTELTGIFIYTKFDRVLIVVVSI